jgi:hypothetical protein
VVVPKLREGAFFPDWLLQRRRRAEAALTTVVATCYLLGVSTRRIDRLVQSLGIAVLSKSQVSEMAKVTDVLHTPGLDRPPPGSERRGGGRRESGGCCDRTKRVAAG